MPLFLGNAVYVVCGEPLAVVSGGVFPFNEAVASGVGDGSAVDGSDFDEWHVVSLEFGFWAVVGRAVFSGFGLGHGAGESFGIELIHSPSVQ